MPIYGTMSYKPANPISKVIARNIMRQYRLERARVRQLSKHYRISEARIYDLIHANGDGSLNAQILPNPPIPDHKAYEIRRLYATGEYSYRDLAKRFFISHVTVLKVVNLTRKQDRMARTAALHKLQDRKKLARNKRLIKYRQLHKQEVMQDFDAFVYNDPVPVSNLPPEPIFVPDTSFREIKPRKTLTKLNKNQAASIQSLIHGKHWDNARIQELYPRVSDTLLDLMRTEPNLGKPPVKIWRPAKPRGRRVYKKQKSKLKLTVEQARKLLNPNQALTPAHQPIILKSYKR
jgi:Mor family transcriptional regulator